MTDSTPAIAAVDAAGVPYRVVRTEAAGSAEESRRSSRESRSLRSSGRSSSGAATTTTCSSSSRPAGASTGRSSAAHLGVSRLSLPDADEAREVTGYERYTITPFGATRPWPVIADAAILGEPVVSIGGGVRGVNIHLAPADLVAATSATVVDVTE